MVLPTEPWSGIPETPSPIPSTPLQCAIRVGPLYLNRLFERFLSRAEDGCAARVAVMLHRTFGSHVHMATCCSGTDSPLLVFDSLRSVLQAAVDCQVGISHAFSSEANVDKQAYIRHCFPDLSRLFPDTRVLGNARAHNVCSSSEEVVPAAHGLVGGFPCTAISRLNPHGHEQANRTCVATGDLSTGSVFKGIADYAARHSSSLRFLILENVPGCP